MYDNPIIKKRFEEKMKRLDKTSLSILISWAINNASNFLPEHLKGTKRGFNQILKWYPKFIDLYREWMLENLPASTSTELSPENTKPPTPKEAQHIQEEADRLRDEVESDEDKAKRFEELPIIEEK